MAIRTPIGHEDYWAGRVPCWILRGCVEEACDCCAAFYDRSRPCWEQDTLCKRLLDMESCYTCEVYIRYSRSATAQDRGTRPSEAR